MLDQGPFLSFSVRKLLAGIDIAYQSIKGSYGLNPPSSFLSERGVSRLERISLSDSYEALGISFARSLAERVQKKHGDGVSTALLLLHAIVKESIASIEEGMSRYDLCLALREHAEKLLQELANSSWKVKDISRMHGILKTSLPFPEIVERVEKALSLTGAKGFLTLVEGTEPIRVVPGLRLPVGYLSPHFAAQNAERTICLVHPKIFVTDKKISSSFHLLPLLKSVFKSEEHLVIFCRDIDPDTLATLVINRLEDLVKVSVVCDPRGDSGLEDIALFTGTSVYSQPFSPTSPQLEYSALGHCSYVEISQTQTVLVEGRYVPEVLNLRVHQIEEQLRTKATAEERSRFVERKDALQRTTGVIPIQKEERTLYTLACKVVDSSLQEGYVLGGGVALFQAARTLIVTEGDSIEVMEAARILQKACKTPIKELAHTVGLEAEMVLSKLASGPSSLGLNIASKQIEDMVVVGILDPLARIRDIFSYALDAAQRILSSEVLLSTKENM